MKKYVIIAALCAMSATYVSAQGYRYTGSKDGNDGYTRSTLCESYSRMRFAYTASFDVLEGEKSDEALHGGSVQFLRAFSLSRVAPVFVATGIDATYNISAEKDKNCRYKFLGISIPVQASVKIPFTPSGEISIEPYGGIHVKVNALAHYGDIHEYKDYFKEEDMKGLEFNRVQTGWQVGGGLNLGDLYIGYEYRKDIKPFGKDPELKRMYHFISLGSSF